MRKAIILAFAPIALMTVALSTPAIADANVKDVLGACDRTPGCNYTINKKDGVISGCSTQSGVCFNCGKDGKCSGTDPKARKVGKGRAVNIGGVEIPSGKASPAGKGGSKVTGKNLGNTTSSNTDPQTKGPTEGRRHEGGGARHK